MSIIKFIKLASHTLGDENGNIIDHYCEGLSEHACFKKA